MTKMQVAQQRLDSVQIIRGLAAFAVALAHFHHQYIQQPGGISFGYGGFGVDLFFVVSGFIMIVTGWRLFGERNGAVNFMARRAARIVPLYWAASALFLYYVLTSQPMANADISWPVVLASFLFIPWERPSGVPFPMYSIGWTLNHEMFFYVVVSIGLLFRRGIGIAFVILLITGLVFYQQWYGPGIPHPLGFWAHPVALEFVFGVMLALVFKTGLRINRLAAIFTIGAGFFLSVFVYATTAYGFSLNLLGARHWWWGLSATLILAGAVLHPWGATIRAFRPLVTLGDASYALYVLHPLFVYLVQDFFGRLWAYQQFMMPTKNWPYVIFLTTAAVATSLYVHKRFEVRLTDRLYARINAMFPVGRARPVTDIAVAVRV